MKGWGTLFTDDVDYVNRLGGWWKGNRESGEGHELIHDALKKQEMTYNSAVDKIRLLKPEVAMVHAICEWPGFTLKAGEEVEDFQGIITMVMVKQDGKQLIRGLQNTLTSTPPMPEQPKRGK